jgi:hypothetical protein
MGFSPASAKAALAESRGDVAAALQALAEAVGPSMVCMGGVGWMDRWIDGMDGWMDGCGCTYTYIHT